MDGMIGSIAIVAALFLFVLPIFLLVRSQNLKRRANVLETENANLRDELRRIALRVRVLEQSVEALRVGAQVPKPTQVEAPPVGVSAQPNIAEPAVLASETALPAPQPKAPTLPVSPAFPRPETITLTPIAHDVLRQTRPPETSHRTGPSLQAATNAESGRWADLEERLGANWLNKIGTAAFVIGVALLLNYSMHYLGARGKIGLGYALGLVFLLAGIWGERKERYRIGARAVLGGGWALTYFTTYALHNIAAVRLVQNPVLGFSLLFIVAVAMVIHSLRYRSEVTTGFAFLLAFASVAVSTIPVGALIASALLAAALVLILRARRWYALEPFAIAATYMVHQLWINQIYRQIGGHKPFAQFPISVTLLSIYWLIYLISYFLRSEEGSSQKQMLTASFLVNACGYLAVLHSQAFHPEWRFWFLLVAGALYFAVSAYSRSIGRRLGFILASTLGATLMLAAVPYRYSGRGLEIFWLVDAEALLIVGWRAADAHLRKLGWAAMGVLSGYVLVHDLSPRFELWRPPNAKLGWMLLALAAALYFDGTLHRRLASQADKTDETASQVSILVGTLFLLASAWVALPFLWTGLAWTALAIALVSLGTHFGNRTLTLCGRGSTLLAVVRLLAVNMSRTDTWHGISLRLVTVGTSAALLYLSTVGSGTTGAENRRGHSVSQWLSQAGGWPVIYTGSASFLMSLLLWNELSTAAVALAWGIFGLLLLQVADLAPGRQLQIQGRLLLLASFARIFFADLNSTSQLHGFPVPVITVGLLAVIYYFAGFNTSDAPRIRASLLWFGSISIAALLRFEWPLEWVAVGWAAFTVVLYTVSRRFRLTTFSNQSYAMALLVGIRCAFDNFYQLGPWRFTDVRVVTVVSSAVLLYLPFAAAQYAKLHGSAQALSENVAEESLFRHAWALIQSHPEHLFFFIPTILLTVLLSLEVRPGFLTAAWGVEAVVVFLAIMKMDERAYRWFSLLLLLLCVARIVTVDIWTLDALGRIVSFMALGAALLAVSFLYARHRELLRRVL